MEVIYLGMNDIGMRIYEWLCQRDSVNVIAMLTEPDQLGLVQHERPDLILSVGFDHLVPPEILSIPIKGAINLHPSYLPYNRGKSPNVWPLIEEIPAGVTLHYMDADFDTGDIIAQKTVETKFSDTGKTLHHRLETAQFELFTNVWPDIESGNVEATPQNPSTGTYHSTSDFTELCKLDPDEEVRVMEFLNRIRALTFPPFNNAYLEIENEKHYIDVDIRKEEDISNEEVDGLLSSY